MIKIITGAADRLRAGGRKLDMLRIQFICVGGNVQVLLNGKLSSASDEIKVRYVSPFSRLLPTIHPGTDHGDHQHCE